MDALWVWRQFPRQIASDLRRYHGLKLADWHRETLDADGHPVLSSYELLELVEYLPKEGAFKTAARGGEFSSDEQVWRFMATELSKLRAGFHAVHGGERYVPKVFLTLEEMRENVAVAESAEEKREHFFSFADRTPKPPRIFAERPKIFAQRPQAIADGVEV